jgi:hypothetical protein
MEIRLEAERYRHMRKLTRFLQAMVDRLLVGFHRYGDPDAGLDYLRRIKESIDRYEATGNLEHLVDAANYCWLEFGWPLHPEAHFEAEDSRGRNL